ncbi:MAG TPA: PKD domain-containing protein [Cyclobacteriaceae bacterium]|nr:PKD domain-containing protein [Cyclobacteriaceae bacterium]
MKGVFLACGLFLISVITWGQTVTADFSVTPSACLNENLKPDNQSTNASRYEWDLCQGDLATTPEASAVANVGGTITAAVDVVFDGTNWYGFVTSQNTNSIIRLDFGPDIFSTPTITDLGNVSGKTNFPMDIKVVNDNGNWYGFVYNQADPMVSRINFGNSLTNTTSSSSPITADAIYPGIGTVNGGFDMMYDGTNWIIVTTNFTVFTIIRMPTISGTPAGPDVISGIPNPYGYQMGDISLVKANNNYYGYVISASNKSLQRLSFGTTLFSTPTIDDIPMPLFASYSPLGLDIGYDDNMYTLFVASSDGHVLRVTLGDDPSILSTTVALAGNFPILENTLKIRLVKDKTSWLAFTPSWQSNKVYRLAFQNPQCNTILTTASPIFSFSDASPKAITLRAFNNSGAFSEATHIVNVSSGTAPQADFTITGICTTSASQFSANSQDNIVSYDWNYGDAATGAGQNSSHQYAAGTYDVTLVATSSNGCTNSFFKSTQVYNQPVPDFTTPTGLICTNNEFEFANLTTDNFDGHLVYEWSVEGATVGNERDLHHAFTAQGDNDVKLKVSIPGCSDELTKTVNNVQAGPTVGFTFSGKCEEDSFAFTNTSAGDISGYSWDFSDGPTSTETNPTHVYTQPGIYDVSLSTTATNGCVSTTTTSINVYSLPVPAFSIDLPPFSCSGSPSQFHDNTPAPTDSNLGQWNWTFGDNGAGSGEDPTHTYTNAGTYNVKLTVTTDRNCTASTQHEVTIAPSPVAAFTSIPACVNQSTAFTSTSTGDIKSWQWKIGSATYNVASPSHTFAAAGSSSVQLTVTGTNDCVSTATRSVTVPVLPSLDFTIANRCSGQAVAFNDITTSTTDPISQRNWTFNGGGATSGQQVNYTFDTGTYPVKLQITNQSGCVYSVTKQVVINPSPVAAFNTSIDVGPAPLHVVFTNASTGATAYKWNFNDGNAPKTDASTEYTYNTLGDYTVDLTATSAEGCSRTASKVVSVVVPRDELALEEFSLVQAGTGYRGYIRVRNNGNYRIGGFSVSYDVGGGVLLKENVTAIINPGQSNMILLSNQFLSPSSESYICAELQGDTNLVDNKACTVLTNNAVILAPYPNPTDKYLNLETVQPTAGTVRVRLYSSSGGNAYDKTFDVAAGLSRLTLDVENLSPGMYVAVVTAGDVTTSRHFLIAR